MYELSVNSEVIQSIYDMPLGKSNWLQVAELMGDDLSAASIKIALTGSQETAMVLAEADFLSYTASENTVSKLGNGPEEMLGQHAVQGVALHIERLNESDYSKVNQAVGHVEIGTGMTLLIDLLPHPDKKEYSSIDLWRFQYYLIHIKKALESEGMFGTALPESVYDNNLKKKYDLSHAESRLLIALYHCSCLKTAAAQLQRSDHTVRSQMKNIFKKTETKNQLALFKKILA